MDYKSNYGKRYSFQNTLLVISPYSDTTGHSSLSGRGKVSGFSPSSGVRMRKYLRNSMADYRYMLTLTYPGFFSVEGRECKEHLRRFIQELKRKTRATDAFPERFSVFWFMEFQKRGAFHFHAFLTHKYDRQWIAELWYRIVNSEDDRHLRAGTRIETMRSGRHGCVSYASKYAAKQDQKEVPDFIKDCGRFWGVSGLRVVMAADTKIPEKMAAIPSVTRATERLKDILRDLVKKDEVRFKKMDGGTLCFFIKTKGARMQIQSACWRLETIALSNGGFPAYNMPHLESEEDAEGLLLPTKQDKSAEIYAQRLAAYSKELVG